KSRRKLLPQGSMVVCVRGYKDYGWFKSLTLNGIFYGTRQRCNAAFEVIERLPLRIETASSVIRSFDTTRCVRQVVYYGAKTHVCLCLLLCGIFVGLPFASPAYSLKFGIVD
ncbi:MAG: hypothetical protein ACU83N_15390, partial [Gammaproteobacteria bacterium]